MPVDPSPVERSGQYAELEGLLLDELMKRIRSGEASSSELATAAGLLGKAGTPARSAGAGIKGSEEAAFAGWLKTLTPEQQEALVRDTLKKAPVPMRPAGGRRAG